MAAAIQVQLSRDFEGVWNIRATIAGFETLDEVPVGYWPVTVVNQVKGAAGIHLDEQGDPYALVQADQQWSLTASHEALEMLVDPVGNRRTTGANKRGQGLDDVRYLVEVCDPSEDAKFGYRINGVLVSDFYTPHYFDRTATAGVRHRTRATVTPQPALRCCKGSWSR